MNSSDKQMLIKNSIRDIPDFPKPGIIFKDITTLISNPKIFKLVIDLFEEKFQKLDIDYIAVPESRGFLFGAPLAQRLELGLTLIRKPGKLPAKTFQASYELEYGTDILTMHEDAFEPGSKLIIIDDLLATGGSAAASIDLIEQAQGKVLGAGFVIELAFLEGRKKLENKSVDVFSLVEY